MNVDPVDKYRDVFHLWFREGGKNGLLYKQKWNLLNSWLCCCVVCLQTLFPVSNPRRLRLWVDYFLRFDETAWSKQDPSLQDDDGETEVRGEVEECLFLTGFFVSRLPSECEMMSPVEVFCTMWTCFSIIFYYALIYVLWYSSTFKSVQFQANKFLKKLCCSVSGEMKHASWRSSIFHLEEIAMKPQRSWRFVRVLIFKYGELNNNVNCWYESGFEISMDCFYVLGAC